MGNYLIDVYTDYNRNNIIFWLKNNQKTQKKVIKYYPKIYVSNMRFKELKNQLKRYIDEIRIKRANKKTWLGREKEPVLEIQIKNYEKIREIADRIYKETDFKEKRIYNVDLSIPFRAFNEYDLYPFAEIEDDEIISNRFCIDYKIPELKEATIKIEPNGKNLLSTAKKIDNLSLNGEKIRGNEKEILKKLESTIKSLDPDIIYTKRNKSLKYLFKRAQKNKIDLRLGRGEGTKKTEPKSYESYGRVIYKPTRIDLNGRIHINEKSSFIYKESGIEGLIELSRLSRKHIQEVANISPGTIISAIQASKALSNEILIPWHKSVPEEYKSARDLIKSDKGGFIYQPRTGFHKDVKEVDFSSLYPNIILKKNISPETVNCDCCNNQETPYLNYSICKKKKGFLSKVLEPLIDRRNIYKKIGSEEAEKRSNALKWVLVTCFGYTGYKNAKFGKIECHESICSYGRKILTKATKLAEEHGFEVLHGIVDSLWLKGKRNSMNYLKNVKKDLNIPIDLDKRYKWIVFLPRRTSKTGALNKYYGVSENSEIKARGIELRNSDSPKIVKELQKEILNKLREVNNKSEFIDKKTQAKKILNNYLQKIEENFFSVEKLIIESKISNTKEQYKVFNDNLAALKRYEDLGIQKRPGEKVEYIIRNSDLENNNRVRVKEEEVNEIDLGYYREELKRAYKSLFLPFYR